MTQKKKPDAPFVPRKPDYDVSAMKKGTQYKGKVGAAWKNDKGQIQIYLNPFVVLDASEDLALTLFPVPAGESRPFGSPDGTPLPRDPGPPESEPDPAPGGDPIPF